MNTSLVRPRMTQDDVTVHKIHHNSLWVFGRMGTAGYNWPESIKYHERTFYFASNEAMPGESGLHYTGYARFECRDDKQKHVTHREFGMYLQAIASNMIGENKKYSDSNPSRLVVPYLMTNFGLTKERATFVDEWCWSRMRTVSPNTANE